MIRTKFTGQPAAVGSTAGGFPKQVPLVLKSIGQVSSLQSQHSLPTLCRIFLCSINMGAAASMKHIYSDAMDWFRFHFDSISYIETFQALDIDGDGVITLPELFVWLHDKARNKSTWDIIEMNHSICAVAYQVAGKQDVSKNQLEDAALDLHSFRDFLVQLYVLCILWVHFKSADSVGDDEHVNDQCLDLPKFIVACRTFSRAQAHEPLTEARLTEDFNLLDTNQNGSVEFSEVCAYCAQFFSTDFANQFDATNTAAMMRRTHLLPGEEVVTTEKVDRSFLCVRKPSQDSNKGSGKDQALDVIAKRVQENQRLAQLEKIRINTESILGISSL